MASECHLNVSKVAKSIKVMTFQDTERGKMFLPR